MLRGLSIDVGEFFIKTIGGCTYWFVSALVVAEIIIFLLLLPRWKNIWFYVVIAVCFFIAGYFLGTNRFSIINGYPGFPWQYKQGFEAVLFLTVGGYCGGLRILLINC